MEPVQLSLLGSVRVERGGVPVEGFESRKALALLCYLALQSQPRTRSHLAELFWEGKTEERGRGNLSRVVHNLTQLVPGCLESTRYTIALTKSSHMWIDAQVFDVLVTQGNSAALTQAAELYRGDLLADLQLEDCSEFDQWLASTREHWRQRQTQVLHMLVTHHLHNRNSREGIRWATRLIEIDPWQEEAHRAMMQLLYLDGQRSAALAQYDICRRVLREELGVDPEEATVALYTRIRDTPDSHADIEPSKPTIESRLDDCSWNVPSPPTSFVSRDDEIAVVIDRLCDPLCRLVTITGPGGVGKSRLAIHALHELESLHFHERFFPDGCIFIPLAAIQTMTWHESTNVQEAADQALATSIATALQITFSGPYTLQKQVLNFLCGKRMLVILDNCEHLMEAGPFLLELLRTAPGMNVLATSQLRFHLEGEHVVDLKGLHVPSSSPTKHDWTDWHAYSAMALFQQRAGAVLPGFEVTADTYDAVTRICQLVDGLPLGIELAVQWIRVLTCHEIAHEIALNLRFLHNAHNTSSQRHHSLLAVFDYTWRSLPMQEQRVLRQLSVFRGGFTRHAATEVVGASLDILAALVDRSLLYCTPSHDQVNTTTRYELLEVTRQYAAEKLAETSHGDASILLANERHQHYYLAFLSERTHALRGQQQQRVLVEIYQEINNIRRAWQWAVAHGCWTNIDRAAESLFHFYDMRSWFQEGETLFAQTAATLEAIQPKDRTTDLIWGKVMARQGWFAFHGGRHHEARQLLERSVAILRPLDSPREIVFPLHRLAAVFLYEGAYDNAARVCQEALAISEAHSDPYTIAISKTILAQIAAFRGDYHVAERLCKESLVIDRAIGNGWGIAFSLMNLGQTACSLKNYVLATSCFQEVLATREALADTRGIARCLNYLGDIALAQDEYGQAMMYYQSSVALCREIGNQWGVTDALIRLGYAAWTSSDTFLARISFHEALQTATQTQILPKMLEAFVGIALLMSEAQPEEAYTLVTWVSEHALSTKDARDRATMVMTHVRNTYGFSINATHKQYDDEAIETIAMELLLTTSQPYS